MNAFTTSLKFGTAIPTALLLAAGSAQAFSIGASSNVTDLTNSLLGNGVTIVGEPTLTGTTNSSGLFTGGSSAGLGFDSGVILSTGDVNLAVGPNSSPGAGIDNGLPGDLSLSALAGAPTFNATILELDFQFGDGSVGGDLFFNYIFASEEFLEFVNAGFNDTFGLFVDGVNVATLPGGGQAVSIDNVNADSNSEFFNDNENGDFNIEFDGFTDPLTAEVLGLSAGTHTLKLAIADAGDGIFDSALFIQGNSIADTPTRINAEATPEPSTVTGTLITLGLGLWLRRRFMRHNTRINEG